MMLPEGRSGGIAAFPVKLMWAVMGTIGLLTLLVGLYVLVQTGFIEQATRYGKYGVLGAAGQTYTGLTDREPVFTISGGHKEVRLLGFTLGYDFGERKEISLGGGPELPEVGGQLPRVELPGRVPQQVSTPVPTRVLATPGGVGVEGGLDQSRVEIQVGPSWEEQVSELVANSLAYKSAGQIEKSCELAIEALKMSRTTIGDWGEACWNAEPLIRAMRSTKGKAWSERYQAATAVLEWLPDWQEARAIQEAALSEYRQRWDYSNLVETFAPLREKWDDERALLLMSGRKWKVVKVEGAMSLIRNADAVFHSIWVDYPELGTVPVPRYFLSVNADRKVGGAGSDYYIGVAGQTKWPGTPEAPEAPGLPPKRELPPVTVRTTSTPRPSPTPMPPPQRTETSFNPLEVCAALAEAGISVDYAASVAAGKCVPKSAASPKATPTPSGPPEAPGLPPVPPLAPFEPPSVAATAAGQQCVTISTSIPNCYRASRALGVEVGNLVRYPGGTEAAKSCGAVVHIGDRVCKP